MKLVIPIRIGRHTSTEELIGSMAALGVTLSSWPQELIKTVELPGKIQDVRLQAVHLVNDLGLEGTCFFKDIITAGSMRGLVPMTMEMAFEARLHYQDQPRGEYLPCIMNPVPVPIPDEQKGDLCNDGCILSLDNGVGTICVVGVPPILRFHPSRDITASWNPLNEPDRNTVLFLAE